VVINSFYVTCLGACPPISKKITELQNAFTANLGKNLFFVSITVDPETDTPEKLKAYAAKYGAKPGRLFLTGTKENVAVILKKLGQYSEDKTAHPTIILIGNDKTGLWKKAFAMMEVKDLVKNIESVLADKP
jgi:protein SCO1/2